MDIFDAAWLYASLRMTSPILFAAMGELVAQRSGVINIGLEGMMLAGAFGAFVVFWVTGSFALGILGGLAAGALLGAIMALLSIDAKADQIVVGVGILILAIGLTTFLDQSLFETRERLSLDRLAPYPIPLLSQIPFFGPLLFNHVPLVYPAFLSVPGVWFFLQRSNAGISVRAVGENPEAADTAGVNVRLVRWLCTLFAGAMAGIGGAFLSIGQLGLFVENMSAGRGFLALAAVFFGKWQPRLVMLGCFLFGAATALQLRIQAEPFVPNVVWLALAVVFALSILVPFLRRGSVGSPRRVLLLGLAGTGSLALFAHAPQWSLPSQLWVSAPYVLALAVLGGFLGRSRMPKAMAQPYRRGDTE